MGATLDDAVVIDDKYLVSVADRAEPVCDHKGRAPFHQAEQRLLWWISACDNTSTAQFSSKSKYGDRPDRPCDCNQLSLPLAKVVPFSDTSVW
ncbi:MAG: hypothetical protein R2932_34945 [Caldilineaceae bacterium]